MLKNPRDCNSPNLTKGVDHWEKRWFEFCIARLVSLLTFHAEMFKRIGANSILWGGIAYKEAYKKIRENSKPRGQVKHSFKFFSDSQKSQGIVTLYEKIYDGEPILTVFSNIGEEIQYNTVVSAQCMMWKVCRRLADTQTDTLPFLEIIIDFKWQKQGPLGIYRPLTGWGLHRFVWKSRRE